MVAPSPARSFSRPDLAIPRRTTLRAVPASQQSSTPFHQAKISLPNLKVIAKKAGGAIHVLDRFHIMQKMPLIDERGGAIDEVRAGEARQLKEDGYEEVLKHSRWCLLKRPENRTDKQTITLAELLQYNLRSVRAHLLREDWRAVLGIRESCLGREVPRPVVYTDDALKARTDEEGCPHFAESSGADSQLVPSEGRSFQRNRRRIQQQSQTDHEKILRLSHLRSH